VTRCWPVSTYDYMLFVDNVKSCMCYWQNSEAEAYNSRQVCYPRRVVTVATAVFRGLRARQRGVSSHRIATLIRSVAKAIGTPNGPSLDLSLAG